MLTVRVVLVALLAIAAPWIATHDPQEINPLTRLQTLWTATISETLLPLAQLDQHGQEVTDALAHARRAELPSNPWTSCVGIALRDFLARPMDEFLDGRFVRIDGGRDAG